MQTLIVLAVVVCAVAYIGRRIYVAVMCQNNPCSGCAGCALKDIKANRQRKNKRNDNDCLGGK